MATQDTNSGICPACERKVLAPQHRRCMYCGLELPKDLVLSEAESASVLRDKHEQWRAETAAVEARKPKIKDTKRNRRKKAEPDESESAILLDAMAAHHATKRDDALENSGSGVAREAAGTSASLRKVVAEPAPMVASTPAPKTEAEVLAAARVQAAKLKAARTDAARTDIAKTEAAKVQAAKVKAAKLKIARLEAKLKRKR